jgi:hypothetical protein
MPTGLSIRGRLYLAVAIGSLGVACGDSGGTCIEVDVDCDPLYEPTFDNVFAMTLNDKCTDAPCHDAEAPRAGLSYVDPDEAYDLLLGNVGGRSRVEPGDPNCSLIIRRIESTSSGFRMPPGTPLVEEEKCSIRQWIANGAER